MKLQISTEVEWSLVNLEEGIEERTAEQVSKHQL